MPGLQRLWRRPWRALRTISTKAFWPRSAYQGSGQTQCRMRAERGLQIYKCGACTLLLRGGAKLISLAVLRGLTQIYVFADCHSYFNSFTGKARNPWARGKLCAARQTTAPGRKIYDVIVYLATDAQLSLRQELTRSG